MVGKNTYKEKESTYTEKENLETMFSKDTDSDIYWWDRNLVFKRDNEVQSSKQVTGGLVNINQIILSSTRKAQPIKSHTKQSYKADSIWGTHK